MAKETMTVLASLKAKKGKTEEVKKLGLALVGPTRAEAGCVSYDFHQDTTDENIFIFYENWASKQAFEKHVQTSHLQDFIAKTKDLLDGPLDVKILKKLS